MQKIQKITPCLWFDGQAEQAACYYVDIFPNSSLGNISRFSDVGKEVHGREPGSVMVIEFRLDGQSFTGLNGGPLFKFNEAISLMVHCETQDEIDHYWKHLSAGGPAEAQQCGWLKDKFGLSWQIVPTILGDIMSAGGAASERAMAALLKMKKLDIAQLKAAAAG
jgi:predicted 3-demethylubiquinone-9 3-methyltransferase (glyoxalase superfamily)